MSCKSILVGFCPTDLITSARCNENKLIVYLVFNLKNLPKFAVVIVPSFSSE